MKELRYFVKWKGCPEDENTWEAREGMKNAQEVVERFHRETRRCRAPERSSNIRKVSHRWISKLWWFLVLLCGA